MNTLFKSILLSQCFAFGLTSAFAANPAEEGPSEEPAAIPKGKIFLTMPHQRTKQNRSYTDKFRVAIKGSISGERWFDINYRGNATFTEPTCIKGVRKESPLIYNPLTGGQIIGYRKIVQDKDGNFNFLPDEKKRQLFALHEKKRSGEAIKKAYIDKHLLFNKFDFSVFEGNISISMSHFVVSDDDDTLRCTSGIEPSVKPIPIPVNLLGTICLNSRTENLWIMLTDDFREAFLTVWKGQGVRSLRGLALTRVLHNIANNPDEEYSKSSVEKALPEELVQLIPSQTWKQRKANEPSPLVSQMPTELLIKVIGNLEEEDLLSLLVAGSKADNLDLKPCAKFMYQQKIFGTIYPLLAPLTQALPKRVSLLLDQWKKAYESKRIGSSLNLHQRGTVISGLSDFYVPLSQGMSPEYLTSIYDRVFQGGSALDLKTFPKRRLILRHAHRLFKEPADFFGTLSELTMRGLLKWPHIIKAVLGLDKSEIAPRLTTLEPYVKPLLTNEPMVSQAWRAHGMITLAGLQIDGADIDARLQSINDNIQCLFSPEMSEIDRLVITSGAFKANSQEVLPRTQAIAKYAPTLFTQAMSYEHRAYLIRDLFSLDADDIPLRIHAITQYIPLLLPDDLDDGRRLSLVLTALQVETAEIPLRVQTISDSIPCLFTQGMTHYERCNITRTALQVEADYLDARIQAILNSSQIFFNQDTSDSDRCSIIVEMLQLNAKEIFARAQAIAENASILIPQPICEDYSLVTTFALLLDAKGIVSVAKAIQQHIHPLFTQHTSKKTMLAIIFRALRLDPAEIASRTQAAQNKARTLLIQDMAENDITDIIVNIFLEQDKS